MIDLTLLVWPTVAFLVSFGILFLGSAVWMARLRQARMMRSVLAGVATGMQEPLRPGAAAIRARFPRLWAMAETLAAKVDILRGEDPEQTALSLTRAGLSGREWRVVYAMMKIIPLLLGTAAALVWVVGALLGKADLLMGVLAILGSTLLLMRASDLWLARRTMRRNRSVRRFFPGMLELLAVACESGLASGPAMRKVSQRLQGSCPDLSEELDRLLSELSLMSDREEAYSRLAQRIDLPEVATFTQVLSQTERFGTPFSAALRTLMGELRAHRLLRIEEKAGRLPVMLAVPLILCILPALFVVIAGPGAITMADTLFDGTLVPEASP